MRLGLLLAFLLVSAALAEIHQRIDLIVAPECLKKPIHFIDCDLSDPAHEKCKTMEPLDFRHACSEVHVVQIH